jgi:hypothetical protein
LGNVKGKRVLAAVAGLVNGENPKFHFAGS